jgi:crotonobetainyl-CoA:carnitine CoA-transferase CaiB-like acyl-CoA transferase
LKVVDLTQIVSGPYCTMLLADQGADVIKVEPPGIGDLNRANPFFARGGLNAIAANNNRGKRSIAVDLAKARGVRLVSELVAGADVFIQNFRPGVAERLGLGEAALRAVTPELIYCSIAGYGFDGPWADRPVFDPIIQAMSGHVAVQVNPDVPIPDLVRTVVVDKATALTTAQAITAALLVRSQGGGGQHVQVSMLDAALAFFWPDGMMAHTMLDEVPVGPTLYQIYRLSHTSDGYLVYFAASEPQFMGLFRALGHPEWCDDPRWGERATRIQGDNFAALGQAIVAAFLELDTETALARLAANDVPAGPVLSLEELPGHEQVVHNGALVEWEHPTAGRLRQALPAARFSATPTDPRLYAPVLGAETDEILAGLGYDGAAITALREAGTVA